jgi:hypothetical protein
MPKKAEKPATAAGCKKLNAFLERVWAVGGCSAFSVPFIVCQAHLENDESQKMVLYYRESRSKVL